MNIDQLKAHIPDETRCSTFFEKLIWPDGRFCPHCYGRTVGMVYVVGESLNQTLVKNGFAWVYRYYCKKDFCKDWISLESVARENKIGLWVDPDPIPPWEFRHGKSENSKTNEPAKVESDSYNGKLKSKVFH